jgi:hypothetical protein
MRHAHNDERGSPYVERVASTTCAASIGRLPLERQCKWNDFVFVEGIAVGDAATCSPFPRNR